MLYTVTDRSSINSISFPHITGTVVLNYLRLGEDFANASSLLSCRRVCVRKTSVLLLMPVQFGRVFLTWRMLRPKSMAVIDGIATRRPLLGPSGIVYQSTRTTPCLHLRSEYSHTAVQRTWLRWDTSNVLSALDRRSSLPDTLSGTGVHYELGHRFNSRYRSVFSTFLELTRHTFRPVSSLLVTCLSFSLSGRLQWTPDILRTTGD